MNDDDFVTIAELDDPVKIEMLVDLLAQHDIPAQTPGLNHRAMLGFQGAYISVRLKVPRAKEIDARELVSAFSEAPSEGPERTTPETTPPELAADPAGKSAPSGPRKLRRIVAFCALSMTFGTGHFYAGDFASGWILFGAEVFAITLGSVHHTRAAWLALPLLVVWDLLDGMLAVERLGRGERRAFWAQLAITTPIAAACVVAALGSSDWIDRTFPPAVDPYARHIEVPEPPPRPPAGDLVLVPPFSLVVPDAGVPRQ